MKTASKLTRNWPPPRTGPKTVPNNTVTEYQPYQADKKMTFNT